MLFLYSKDAGASRVVVEGEEYRYLFKVRRSRVGESVNLRDLKSPIEYSYKIEQIEKKSATLSLSDSSALREDVDYLHIGWSMCEPKIVEKTLPFLNELGVFKISFIYSERSQKNFKLNLQRVEKILINSSQQCGRVLLPTIEIHNSLDEFLSIYSDAVAIDFSDELLSRDVDSRTFIIGPEGGFGSRDMEVFKKYNISRFGLKGNVLRSETAVVATASLVINM